MDSHAVLHLVPDPESSRHGRRGVPTAEPVGLPGLLDSAVDCPLEGLGPTGPAPNLAEHLDAYGPLPVAPDASAQLIELLAQVGATGRGGAHFPVARKWRSVAAAARRTGAAPLVVANGAEGEPASAKDAVLLSRRPHLVLDGLAEAGRAVGATEAIVWLHGDAHTAHRMVLQAIHERRAAGVIEPHVRLATGPSRYLSGESSAVVQGLSGGPALPAFRRVPTAVRGVDSRPTLVQNVETLARAGLLARTGAEAHAATVLVTVLVGGRRVVLEVAAGTTMRTAATLAGWSMAAEPQAVLLGGYGGAWLSWDKAAALPLDEPALKAVGGSIGSGVLALLPQGACGVAEAARVATYLSNAGARQCGPCLFGLPAIAGALEELRRGSGRKANVKRLVGWAAQINGRGACHHPDGAVSMALSALTAFADDVDAHRRGKPCAGSTAAPILPVPEEDAP